MSSSPARPLRTRPARPRRPRPPARAAQATADPSLRRFYGGTCLVACLVAVAVFYTTKHGRRPAPDTPKLTTKATAVAAERAPAATTLRVAPKSPKELPAVVSATLEKVVDGDTIWVRIAGTRYKVRYLGINTPESTAHTSKGIEYLGKRAGARNAELLGTHGLRLAFDGPRTDRFGRLLAYIWAGDTLVNRELLRDGLARVYRKAPNIRRYAAFLALEKDAKGAGLGIWDARARERWERSR